MRFLFDNTFVILVIYISISMVQGKNPQKITIK